MHRWLAMVVVVPLLCRALPAQQRGDSAHSDSSAHAQQLRSLVVTASGRLQPVADAPVTTRVISQRDVARSGAQDLNALLTQFTGIQPEPSDVGNGGVQIEGLSSEHILVLIDGEPFVGRIDGELDLSRIPVSIIDHVEVITGPVSTLYGSAAMGGVINVITRKPGGRSFNLSAIGGSQNRRDVDGDLHVGNDTLGAAIDVARLIDDVQAGRPDQSAARERRWDGNGTVQWRPAGGGVVLTGALLGVIEDQRWQSGLLYFFSNNTQIDGRVTAALPTGHDGMGKVTTTLYYSGFDHLSRQATLPEPVSDSGDTSDESLARAEVRWSAPVTMTEVIDAGLVVDRDALTTDRIAGGHRTSFEGEPYAQYTITAGRLSVVPGARLSYSDQWGTHFTPKVAALYHLPANFALRASVAEGYRAPDFKELYLTFLNATVGYVVDGNPDLVPETSTNVTAGVEWSAARAYARVQAYANHFDHFIESVEEADSGSLEQFTYGNVAEGVTRGVDVESGVAIGRVGVDASYGYVYAHDESADLPLLGVTPRSAKLAVHASGPWRLEPSVTLLYWSKAPAEQTTVGFNTVTAYRDPFTRVDARIARAVGAGVEAQVGVQNLFDARPADWPGITERQWYAGVKVGRAF